MCVEIKHAKLILMPSRNYHQEEALILINDRAIHVYAYIQMALVSFA